MKRAHWAIACGCESTAVDLGQRQLLARAIRLWWIGWSCSPTIVTDVASRASVSSVARTAPSIEFSNGTRARSALALVDGEDRVVDGRHGGRARHRHRPARPSAPPRRRSRRARGRRSASAAARRALARQGLGRSPPAPRARARSPSFRRGPASRTAGLLTVEDRRQHDPVAMIVEQRDRARLATAHLVVGVVADDGGVGRSRRRGAARRRRPDR